MTDHRRLQRTLFRMHSDATFAQALLARDAPAIESTGLGAEDLELLMELDPRALAADPGGRRHSQLVGNSASEFTLSLAAATACKELADLLDAFPRSEEFHTALAREGRLPLAFGDYALRRSKQARAPGLQAMLELELGMARLRRAHQPASIPSPHPPRGDSPADRSSSSTVPEIPLERAPLAEGELQLSPMVRLLKLPVGTFDWANALHAGLEAGQLTEAASHQPQEDADLEVVLLACKPGPSAFQLPSIQPELLSFPTDALLWLARSPLSMAARAEFAEGQGATAEALESFLEGFIADGILERGGPRTTQ